MKEVKIYSDGRVVIDGTETIYEQKGMALLEHLYRTEVRDYPKFFKMDALCKLGFLAVELLVRDEKDRFTPREDRAVILFGKSGPLCNDRNYQATVADFPSPSLFVYTLANIVTGEIAIRNKYKGESSFFVMSEKDEKTMKNTLEEAFQDPMTAEAVTGWINCMEENDFEAEIKIIVK
ncbi:MAG: hypothetical protein K5984_02355 [Bacteroidales bacterium]|nr:hypothetical protein [Bacteroidales bacterium]